MKKEDILNQLLNSVKDVWNYKLDKNLCQLENVALKHQTDNDSIYINIYDNGIITGSYINVVHRRMNKRYLINDQEKLKSTIINLKETMLSRDELYGENSDLSKHMTIICSYTKQGIRIVVSGWTKKGEGNNVVEFYNMHKDKIKDRLKLYFNNLKIIDKDIEYTIQNEEQYIRIILALSGDMK